jgi:hypothetical protein
MGTFYLPFSGQFAVQEAHLLFLGSFPFSPHEQLPLPFRSALMATTTRARTTSNTMIVGRFMR